MTWYLSGPMSGIKDSNYPEFARVTAILRSQGVEVVSPHEIPVNGYEWAAYVRDDLIGMLTFCQGIIMLPEWRGSKGACLELYVAEALGMKVAHWDGERMVAA